MAKPIPALGVDPDGSMRANAALILPVQLTELFSWEPYIEDRGRVLELHEMRIAAKRLRYTMEIFAPHYGKAFSKAILRVKRFQELLGRIHDADVLVPQLEESLFHSLKRVPPDERARLGVYGLDFAGAVGVLKVCQQKRDERERDYLEFLALWKRLREEGFFEDLLAIIKRARRTRRRAESLPKLQASEEENERGDS